MTMDPTIAPKYPCDHIKEDGYEFCPKCCYPCGHPNTGQVGFAANPTLLGPDGPGMRIGQCMTIDTQTLQRCNMIISIDMIKSQPSALHKPPKPVVTLN